jgi:regulator of replication initiation timing
MDDTALLLLTIQDKNKEIESLKAEIGRLTEENERVVIEKEHYRACMTSYHEKHIEVARWIQLTAEAENEKYTALRERDALKAEGERLKKENEKWRHWLVDNDEAIEDGVNRELFKEALRECDKARDGYSEEQLQRMMAQERAEKAEKQLAGAREAVGNLCLPDVCHKAEPIKKATICIHCSKFKSPTGEKGEEKP